VLWVHRLHTAAKAEACVYWVHKLCTAMKVEECVCVCVMDNTVCALAMEVEVCVVGMQAVHCCERCGVLLYPNYCQLSTAHGKVEMWANEDPEQAGFLQITPTTYLQVRARVCACSLRWLCACCVRVV
jgi:hypothetical protein